MTTDINSALMQLQRRAEASDREFLKGTFVEAGPLFQLLSSPNHQIIYGRRGTGKTHALSFLAESVREQDDVVVEIDMRTAGSIGAYSSERSPMEARVTQLLVDALGALHTQLVDVALAPDSNVRINLSLLDRMAEALSTIRVTGTLERELSQRASHEATRASTSGVDVSGTGPAVRFGSERKTSTDAHIEQRTLESGTADLEINFSDFADAFQRVANDISPHRLWILLDEWSSLAAEVQPFLADVVRRSLLPVRGVTVKIAAIEDRSLFRVPTKFGDYRGIEVGADMSADINLDDFMVFANDNEHAMDFFATLLSRHVSCREKGAAGAIDADEFVQRGFRDRAAFRELVRAAEGIPRDALNIASLAAQKAYTRPLEISHVREAARQWYHQDKEAAIRRKETRSLLTALIQEVVGRRSKRTFLIHQDVARQEFSIRDLYDARLLHLLKRGIYSVEQPGVRYDGYAIDYGCYVDFIATMPGYGVPNYFKSALPRDKFAVMQGDVVQLDKLRRDHMRRSRESRQKHGRAL